MKIAVFTFVSSNNFGSKLQSFALYRYLTSHGHEVDYIVPKNITIFDRFMSMLDSLFNEKILCIFRYKELAGIKNALKTSNRTKNDYIVHDITNDNFNQHLRIVSKSKLKRLNKLYDAFICGSDQVWSPLRIPLRKYFFLTFASKNRISYAASFGVNTFPSFNRREFKYINRIDYISVREESAKKILEMECPNKKSYVVLDPVFLVTKNEWLSLFPNKTQSGNYAFLFFLNNNETVVEAIKASMRDKHIEVRTINSGDPIAFLEMIHNASYIFTDSFHAVAFSLLFQKNFFCFRRNLEASIQQENRITDLLSLVGLSYRYNKAFDDSLLSMNNIDYRVVSSILETKIYESRNFIDAVLREIENGNVSS